MVPFCLGRLFVLRPVGGGGEGGPGFGGGAGVGVAVGGLLDVEVVPAGGVSVVLPGLHVGKKGVSRLRGAAGGAVDHGHELGAGDGLIGAEGAVGVAVDPAEICGQGDGVCGPVARGDVGEVDRGGLLLGELRQHGGELGAGDGVIGTEGPFNLEIFCGSPDDNNSYYFYDGAIALLQPYIDEGKIVVKSGQFGIEQCGIQNWDGAVAQTRMDNLITAYYSDGSTLDAVLVPYDGLSIGVISSLKNAGYGTADRPLPIVTGQDAEVASVKSIIAGEQAQTVWKDFRKPAEICAQMVDALVKGTEIPVNDTTTYDNGVKVVPAYLCEVDNIDASNYMKLFESGFYDKADDTWAGIVE